jgi:molecular chaperone GrpE
MNKKDKKKEDQNAPKEEQQRTIENLKEEMETKLNEMENNWKRALADYKNLQKRTLKEREDAIKFSNFVLISELIPIFDNLEMVQKHSEDKGLDMIVKQFWEILENAGIEKIEAREKDFDENTMEAIETQEGEEGKVLKVLQRGYKFKERLLKPAKVIVGKKNDSETEKSEEESE